MVNIWENIYYKETILNTLKFYKRCSKKPPPQPLLLPPTQDVKAESDVTDSVVKGDEINRYAIVVSKLVKSYDHFEAVRGISFSVKRGK